mmetsp:Transcript_56329/g.155910  ORF Transcript_56329/g.155910 Transcript_56329/m.155910 type:complete len:251 (-) Transcript_56329:603-1355(-)
MFRMWRGYFSTTFKATGSPVLRRRSLRTTAKAPSPRSSLSASNSVASWGGSSGGGFVKLMDCNGGTLAFASLPSACCCCPCASCWVCPACCAECCCGGCCGCCCTCCCNGCAACCGCSACSTSTGTAVGACMGDTACLPQLLEEACSGVFANKSCRVLAWLVDGRSVACASLASAAGSAICFCLIGDLGSGKACNACGRVPGDRTACEQTGITGGCAAWISSDPPFGTCTLIPDCGTSRASGNCNADVCV